MRSQSDPDAFSQLIMSVGREYQCLVYERSSPHKSWNIRAVFDMDLKSNTGYNNHEYTNVGEQGLCGVILADRRAV